MFKQAKSLLFWTLIYKFRRRLSFVIVLLSLVPLSQWLYGDIVEYLQITEQTEFLHYLLPIKWLLILGCIALSSYLVLTMFKTSPTKKPEEPTKETPIPKNKKKLSEREKSFLKKKLRSEAEILMDR